MLRFWLYITSLIKYSIFASLVGATLTAFFFVIGLTIWGVLLIGAFGAAKYDMDKRYLKKIKKQRHRIALTRAEELRHEIDGFDQAIILTRRGMS